MNNVIRRAAIIMIAAVTMSVTVNAQEKGDLAAGVNLAVGMGDSFTNYGIGAKLQYNVMNPLRLEGSFTYFLKKDYLTMWDLSVNGHWLFPVADKITIYPLAGLSLLGSKVNIDLGEWGGGSASSSDFGVNLGGGIDFKLSDKIFLNVEAKYKLSDTWNRFIASAGVGYRF
jgi:outer membrane protein X